MSRLLRKSDLCPIHHSRFCCGRERKQRAPRASKIAAPRRRTVAVERVTDEHHPRGYREVCSDQELKRRKDKLIRDAHDNGELFCFYCNKELTDYRDIALCHKEPKGMDGARHDDHFDNLCLGHHRCNMDNGSRRPLGANP